MTWGKVQEDLHSLGIQVHFKNNNTIRVFLMAPKIKDSKYQASGVIYRLSAHTLIAQKSTWVNLVDPLEED